MFTTALSSRERGKVLLCASMSLTASSASMGTGAPGRSRKRTGGLLKVTPRNTSAHSRSSEEAEGPSEEEAADAAEEEAAAFAFAFAFAFALAALAFASVAAGAALSPADLVAASLHNWGSISVQQPEEGIHSTAREAHLRETRPCCGRMWRPAAMSLSIAVTSVCV